MLAYDVLLFCTVHGAHAPGTFLPTPADCSPRSITRLLCFDSEDFSPVIFFGDLDSYDGEYYGLVNSLRGADFGGQERMGGREWYREERLAEVDSDWEDEEDEDEKWPGEAGLGLEIWTDEGPWNGEEDEDNEQDGAAAAAHAAAVASLNALLS